MAKRKFETRIKLMIKAYNARKLGCFTYPDAASTPQGGGCRYTYRDGFHCIVGSCLTEEELAFVKQKRMNGSRFMVVVERAVKRKFDFSLTPEQRASLSILQSAHDGNNIQKLALELNTLASTHGLKERAIYVP